MNKNIITDEMIANYHKAVIKFNEDVIEEIGIRNRKELNNGN